MKHNVKVSWSFDGLKGASCDLLSRFWIETSLRGRFFRLRNGPWIQCLSELLAFTFPRWWFQTFFIFTPTWGRFPFWLIFFKWVETTNQWWFDGWARIFNKKSSREKAAVIPKSQEIRELAHQKCGVYIKVYIDSNIFSIPEQWEQPMFLCILKRMHA